MTASGFHTHTHISLELWNGTGQHFQLGTGLSLCFDTIPALSWVVDEYSLHFMFRLFPDIASGFQSEVPFCLARTNIAKPKASCVAITFPTKSSLAKQQDEQNITIPEMFSSFRIAAEVLLSSVENWLGGYNSGPLCQHAHSSIE